MDAWRYYLLVPRIRVVLFMEGKRDSCLQQIVKCSSVSTVSVKGKLFGLTVQRGSGFFVAPNLIVTNVSSI